MIMREVFYFVRFRDISKGEDSRFLKDAIESGLRIYSSDPWNFIYMRRKQKGFHTWDTTDDKLLANTVKVSDGLDIGKVSI